MTVVIVGRYCLKREDALIRICILLKNVFTVNSDRGIFINRSKKKISLTQNITYKTWCVNTQLLSSRVSNCFSLICFKIFSTVFKKRMVLKNYDVFFFSKVQGCKLFISLKTHSYILPIPFSLRIVKLKLNNYSLYKFSRELCNGHVDFKLTIKPKHIQHFSY